MSDPLLKYYYDWLNRYKDDADRRLELLRRCNEIMPACPICKGNLVTWSRLAYNETIRTGHTKDCELARELGDEN